MMELLSVNRDLEETFKQVEKDMLSNIRVDQLPSYQIGMEKGVEDGMEKGVQKGRKQGLEQGIHIQAMLYAN